MKKENYHLAILLVAVYSALFVYILVQLAPIFLDVVAPQNVSRLRKVTITVEYFADQQEYYLLILFHINVVAFIGLTTIMSTESLFIAYVQHVIGMFDITR